VGRGSPAERSHSLSWRDRALQPSAVYRRGTQGGKAGGKGAGGEEKSARAAGCGERCELSRKTLGLRPALLSASPPFPPPLLPFPASGVSPNRKLRGGCFPSAWKCGILYHCTQSSTAQLPISLVDQRLSSLREVLLSSRNTVGWFDSHLAWSSTQSCSCCCKSAFSSS
jgi:hypothetical protein